MICENSVVRGNVHIAADTIVHPFCSISSTNTVPGALREKRKKQREDGGSLSDDDEEKDQERARTNTFLGTNIGHRNIIEERVTITDSKIGDQNLLEVGVQIAGSLIGDGNYIGPKVVLINCIIGDRCNIAPMVRLEGVTIEDSMSVYPVKGRWQCRLLTAADVTLLDANRDAYYEQLLSEDSPQALQHNFKKLEVSGLYERSDDESEEGSEKKDDVVDTS